MLFSPFYQRKKLFERHKTALHPGESKALIYVLKKKQNRMMEQLYGQILADVIVYILGGGGYGWFQKKIYSVDWFRGENIIARK